LAIADPELRAEALELIRGLIERVELHPAEDGFRIELVGEIASMVALSAGADSIESATDRALCGDWLRGREITDSSSPACKSE
jgi:hypothetical protein